MIRNNNTWLLQTHNRSFESEMNSVVYQLLDMCNVTTVTIWNLFLNVSSTKICHIFSWNRLQATRHQAAKGSMFPRTSCRFSLCVYMSVWEPTLWSHDKLDRSILRGLEGEDGEETHLCGTSGTVGKIKEASVFTCCEIKNVKVLKALDYRRYDESFDWSIYTTWMLPTTESDVIIQGWGHQHSVIFLSPSPLFVSFLFPPHLLPLPPPFFLPLPHHFNFLLHQWLVADRAQLEEWVGCESALLHFNRCRNGAQTKLRSTANDQVGGFHHYNISRGRSFKASRPVTETTSTRGEEAVCIGKARRTGLQDDDVIGCQLMKRWLRKGGRARGGWRNGQSRGAAGWRSGWGASCLQSEERKISVSLWGTQFFSLK